jgi:ribose transport system substrate-binding protein
MKSKTTVAIAALIPAALLLAACSGGTTDAAGGGDDSGAWSLGYSTPVGAQPGQQQIAETIGSATTELGWSNEILDANLSVDKQVSDVQTMLQLGVNAIGLWALDSNALRSAYAQAASQDVKLIGLNSEAGEFDGTVSWQTHVCLDGGPSDQTAEYIASAKPDAEVIVIGGPPVASITATVECFTKAAEAAGITIVNQTDNTADDSATAASIVSDLLLQYPDVDAIWSYNDASALGASSAITQAGGTIYDGSNDGVITIGINGDADAIQAVEQGRLTGTWDPNPPATGWAMVKAAELLKDGEPADLIVEATFWTGENLADYVAPEDRVYTLDTIPLVE